MAQSVVGANTFTEQPKSKKKALGRGWVTVRTWHGPRAMADEFISGSIIPIGPTSIDVTEGTPAVITATFPDAEAILSSDPLTEAEDEAIWELIPAPLDKILATHPAFQQSGQTPTAIESIEKALRDGTATETDWNTLFGLANMNDYRNLRVKGVDSWRTWGWTIRKSISVGDAVLVAAEEVDTQKIVTYNQIGIPDDVKWSQPKYKIWDGVKAAEPKLIDEWMACPPTIKYSRKKYDIVREWIGAVKWYKIMYEGGTAETTEMGF
jgi:hypothetical protein